jgi:hypothetical protein
MVTVVFGALRDTGAAFAFLPIKFRKGIAEKKAINFPAKVRNFLLEWLVLTSVSNRSLMFIAIPPWKGIY